MRLLVAVIGTIGLGSVFLVLLILARLTQRWEAVTRSRSHYRLFYLAAALVTLASLVRLVRIGHLIPATGEPALSILYLFSESQSWFYLAFYHFPLAVGVTISVVLAWVNWGWLLREQDD